jgi:biopolymer transport protein ExbD/biopolymer transport protein TolR
MQFRSSTAALESNINVTPLVDVCLVLLIIFMVITPVLNGDIAVNLPKAKTVSELGKGEQLKVTVNADGTVFLNALAVRAEQVSSEVQRLHNAKPAMNVVVRGDKAVKYGEVVKVLDACRAAGYQDVGLASEREP